MMVFFSGEIRRALLQGLSKDDDILAGHPLADTGSSGLGRAHKLYRQVVQTGECKI